jgi:hypothetical protein
MIAIFLSRRKQCKSWILLNQSSYN